MSLKFKALTFQYKNSILNIESCENLPDGIWTTAGTFGKTENK